MSSQTQFKRSQRLASVAVSEIVQIAEMAKARREAGEDVIGLSTGEPDFDTPEHIKVAAAAAMSAGATKYTVTVGTLALREALCGKFARENGFEVDLDEVIVSTGAKQVLFNAMLATLNPGDEVIVPAPYWTSYVDLIAVCGGTPAIVTCGPEQDYKLTPQTLAEAITPRSRWLILNSPSNPTGATYSAAEFAELAAVVEAHPQLWVVTDEIYEHLVYDGFENCSFRRAAPQLADRTLVVNGVSKAYAMTGWRLGYGAGPKDLIAAMAAAQGQITSGASSISQAAAVAALNGPQDSVLARCESFRERRDFVLERVAGMAGLNCRKPEGAYYLFPSCAELLGATTPAGETINDAADFCRYLLAAENVAVVPGRAFGLFDHFRMTYAYARADLERGSERIERACLALT